MLKILRFHKDNLRSTQKLEGETAFYQHKQFFTYIKD